jgi:hypothetical protein
MKPWWRPGRRDDADAKDAEVPSRFGDAAGVMAVCRTVVTPARLPTTIVSPDMPCANVLFCLAAG